MKLFATVVLVLLALHQSSVDGFFTRSGSDIFKSINDVITGVGKEIPNLIPTPSELFNLSKQVLFGLPEVAVFKILNELCSIYLASDVIEPRITPDVQEMFIQQRTPCKNSSFPLAHAEEILDSPDFDVNKKVVILVTGWMTNINEDYIGDMAKAYNCRGGYNFLALSTADSIDTLYTWSAFNTEEVGRILAEALQKLSEAVPTENIHLIGHSLGAHIVGYAGRYFTSLTGSKLSHITGLDPANPCFNDGETLSGLQRNDAEFIDVIHTNPGVLGKKQPLGDVDFYAGGLAPIKPGCVEFGCSHTIAYQYYAESIYPGYETSLMGVRCRSLTKVNNDFCNGPQYPMGFAVPHDLKGSFFLPVNKREPYGENSRGKGTWSDSECGRCPRE